jgi:hypothetical protein
MEGRRHLNTRFCDSELRDKVVKVREAVATCKIGGHFDVAVRVARLGHGAGVPLALLNSRWSNCARSWWEPSLRSTLTDLSESEMRSVWQLRAMAAACASTRLVASVEGSKVVERLAEAQARSDLVAVAV